MKTLVALVKPFSYRENIRKTHMKRDNNNGRVEPAITGNSIKEKVGQP